MLFASKIKKMQKQPKVILKFYPKTTALQSKKNSLLNMYNGHLNNIPRNLFKS
jgi:IS30 family transposase